MHARRLPLLIDQDRCATTQVQRVGVDLPCSSGREAPPLPGRREAKRDGAEQLAVPAACGQLDADAREVLDHARSELDETLAEGIELILCERVRLRNGDPPPLKFARRVSGLQQAIKFVFGARLCPHGMARIRCKSDPDLRGLGG